MTLNIGIKITSQKSFIPKFLNPVINLPSFSSHICIFFYMRHSKLKQQQASEAEPKDPVDTFVDQSSGPSDGAAGGAPLYQAPFNGGTPPARNPMYGAAAETAGVAAAVATAPAAGAHRPNHAAAGRPELATLLVARQYSRDGPLATFPTRPAGLPPTAFNSLQAGVSACSCLLMCHGQQVRLCFHLLERS